MTWSVFFSLQNNYPGLTNSRSAMTIAGILFLMLSTNSVAGDCSPPGIKVFPRPALTTVTPGSYQGRSYNIKTERLVVANPPRTEQAIREVIGAYIQCGWATDQHEKYTMMVRFFYRETEATPRDYVESVKSYFDHDRIEDHDRDVLVTVTWTPESDDLEYHFPSPSQSP